MIVLKGSDTLARSVGRFGIGDSSNEAGVLDPELGLGAGALLCSRILVGIGKVADGTCPGFGAVVSLGLLVVEPQATPMIGQSRIIPVSNEVLYLLNHIIFISILDENTVALGELNFQPHFV